MTDLSMETETIHNNLLTDIDFSTDVDVVTQEVVNNSYQIPGLFTSKKLFELANSSWSKSKNVNSKIQLYLRGCKWSPDGTCCLCAVNNDGVHVAELPRDVYSGDVAAGRLVNILDSVIHVKEAGLVYDFCWYPAMNSSIPETCCWLTTIQNSPIQMWDAFDGSLRCTYRGYNAVDEMEPAISITFTKDCRNIIGGYKKALRTFDIERPGRDFVEHKIMSPATCFALDSNNLLAVGSWNTSISLYHTTGTGTYKSVGKIYGHSGGVTHIKFVPDSTLLVSGARKDHRLLVWDIRYFRRPLNVLHRVVSTNQRIYFDISPCGRYLVTGGTDGVLKMWDSEINDWKSRMDETSSEKEDISYRYPIHNDCCNGVSIHPCRPILATASGQHHFYDPIKKLEEDAPDNSELLSDDSVDSIESDSKHSSKSENSLVFWWTGGMPDEA